MGRGRGEGGGVSGAPGGEMRPIGFQQDVGVEARTEGWRKFFGIKGRIN